MFFSSLDSGLRARTPRRPSDSQTRPMVVLFKYLTPGVKHRLTRFAQRYSVSSSCLIFHFSTHVVFIPDTPNHLNRPTYPSIHSLTHPFIHPFTHSFTNHCNSVNELQTHYAERKNSVTKDHILYNSFPMICPE